MIKLTQLLGPRSTNNSSEEEIRSLRRESQDLGFLICSIAIELEHRYIF
jgi:hypothetical protein